MKYILFGASITHGVMDYTNGGWSGHLQRYLDTKERNNYFYNLAISGDTSRGLLERLEDEAKRRIRNKNSEEITILISIGTNDSRIVSGKEEVDKVEFRENITRILLKSKELSDNVLCIGILPVNDELVSNYKGKYIYTTKRTKEYNDIFKDVAVKSEVPFLDMFDYVYSNNIHKGFPDGLHPDATGHREIYSKVKEFVDKEIFLDKIKQKKMQK